MLKRSLTAFLLLFTMLCSTGCAEKAHGAPIPQTTTEPSDSVLWPKEKLSLNSEGIPELRVYVVDEQNARTMSIETYVEGVLAGEMKNDWPLEALKAQAILARTFVLKFVQDKQSKYPDADISTDVEEAQAFSASDVNEQIRQAVSETRGMVLNSNGELPYAWFHAHSGGATELAKVGLSWDKAEPPYTQCIQSNEPQSASSSADEQLLRDAQNWVAEFTMEEVETAFGPGGVMEMIRGLKEKGIAKNIGFSAHNEDAALKMIELYDFDSVLFPFNWFMNMEHGMGSRLIKVAKEKDMGVLCMKAFIERSWENDAERLASPFPKSWCKPIDVTDKEFGTAAMKYALSLGVDTLIPPGNFASFSFAVNHIDEVLKNPLNEKDLEFLKEKLNSVRGKEFF